MFNASFARRSRSVESRGHRADGAVRAGHSSRHDTRSHIEPLERRTHFAAVPAGYAFFNDPTDTISVGGNTVLGEAATFEARVLFTDVFQGGNIYDEMTLAQEDKAFSAATTGAGGLMYPVNGLNALNMPGGMAADVWHHVAYVYDGAEERIYVDGALRVARPASGDIGEGSTTGFIGALVREEGEFREFTGSIDTLRISNISRYSGDSFAAPTGDLTTDSATELLFNFNELPGSTRAVESSGNGRTGTLGTGFAAATSPQFFARKPAKDDGGNVRGRGIFTSPAGAYAADPSLSGLAFFDFSVNSPKGRFDFDRARPDGHIGFGFDAGNFSFDFESTRIDQLAISGATAQFTGSGTVNGQGDFGFAVTVVDGGKGGVDRIPIDIWDNSTRELIYDSLPGAGRSGSTTAIFAGSIRISHVKHGLGF